MVQSPWSLRSQPVPFLDGQDLRESVTMGRLGLPELLVILAIVIIIFGANRLPEIGRGIGSAIRHFKNETKDDKP